VERWKVTTKPILDPAHDLGFSQFLVDRPRAVVVSTYTNVLSLSSAPVPAPAAVAVVVAVLLAANAPCSFSPLDT
jgi:hypothetical protein